MLPLPILNVRLSPCDADWQQMTPTAEGRHCAHCDRVVHDFTSASAADLARAASPDGRLCGRFRREQLAPRPQLRPKLRRFLVALVLVCGLGLTSGEAWAQVKDSLSNVPVHPPWPDGAVGVYVEQMPIYPGGNDAMMRFIAENTHYPITAARTGKVFVGFTVTATGEVADAKVYKGLEPALDAEAIRVVNSLGRFKPAAQNGRPVAIEFTIPVTFPLTLPESAKHWKKPKML